MQPIIRKAIPEDAKAVAAVINSVILEGQYTALTNPFTEEEERAFIAGLCDRSALFVAEVADEIVGIQVIEPDGLAQYTDAMHHVATIGTWIHANFRGQKIGQLLAETSFRFAHTKNFKKIAIQVIADNACALRFLWQPRFSKNRHRQKTCENLKADSVMCAIWKNSSQMTPKRGLTLPLILKKPKEI